MTLEQPGQQAQPDSQASWRERLVARDKTLRVHLVGIGGTGLSAIARVLLEMGIQVSGSDRQVGAALARLARAGRPHHVRPGA